MYSTMVHLWQFLKFFYLLFFLLFDNFNIFLTVADSYNEQIDSYNCRRQFLTSKSTLIIVVDT